MNKFNLTDYVDNIRQLAAAEGVEAVEAVNHFIVNLSTMSDFHHGAGNLNFRELGQQWNSLSYKVRNKQRADAIEAVKNYGTTTTTRGGF